MFDHHSKPQFHNYPLRTSQLSRLNVQMSQIDQQIDQNRKQIQEINKKFNNQQYQNTFVNRLMQKNRILQLKKQQLQQINKMHQFHQFSENQEKKINLKMHSNLANQYKQIIQENKRKKSQQKEMEKSKDRQILQKNQQQIGLIQLQKQRKKQYLTKNNTFQNFNIQKHSKNNRIESRQNEKRNYSLHLNKNNVQPSQKQYVYMQFHQKNKLKQLNLQKIYKTATQPLNLNRMFKINQIQTKNQEAYLQNLQNKVRRQEQMRKFNKQSLKSYLQMQMQNSVNKKSFERQNKLNEDHLRKNHQIDNQRYNSQARQKTKYQQFLYSSELSKQYNQQVQLQKINSKKSHQHNYLDSSSNDPKQRRQANSPESPHSGIFLGNQKGRSTIHNPLTNPISFSIGMTNPYILKEYQSKRASNNLRGSNLSQIADQSFKY